MPIIAFKASGTECVFTTRELVANSLRITYQKLGSCVFDKQLKTCSIRSKADHDKEIAKHEIDEFIIYDQSMHL